MKLIIPKALVCLILLIGLITCEAVTDQSESTVVDEQEKTETTEVAEDEETRTREKDRQMYVYLTQQLNDGLSDLIGRLSQHVQRSLAEPVSCDNVIRSIEDQLKQHTMVRELYFDTAFYFSSIESALRLISRIQQSAYGVEQWNEARGIFKTFIREFTKKGAELEENNTESSAFEHFLNEHISNTLHMIDSQFFEGTNKLSSTMMSGLTTCYTPFFVQARRIIHNANESLHKIGDIIANDIQRLSGQAMTCGKEIPEAAQLLEEEMQVGEDHHVTKSTKAISLAEVETQYQNEGKTMDLWVDILGGQQGDGNQDTGSVVEYQVVPRAPAAKTNKSDNATERQILGEPVDEAEKEKLPTVRQYQDNLTVEHNPQGGRFADEDEKRKLEPEKVIDHNLTVRKDPQVGKLEDPDEKQKLEPKKLHDFNLTVNKDPQVGKLEDPDEKQKLEPQKLRDFNLTAKKDPQVGKLEDADEKQKLEPQKLRDFNLTAKKDPQVGKLEDPDEKQKLEPQKLRDFNLTAKKDPQVGKLEDADEKQKLEPQKLRDFNLTAKKDPQVGKLEDADEKQKLEPQKLRDFNLTAKKDPQVGKLEDPDEKQKLEPQKLRDFNLTAKKDPQVGKLEDEDEKRKVPPQKVIEHNLTVESNPSVGEGVTKEIDGVPTPRNYDYNDHVKNSAAANLHTITKRIRKGEKKPQSEQKSTEDPEHIAGNPQMEEPGTPSKDSPKPVENPGYPQQATAKGAKLAFKKALPQPTGVGEPARETVNGPEAELNPEAAKDATEYAKVAPDASNHAGKPKAEKVSAIFRPHPNHNHTDYAKVKPDADNNAGEPTRDSVNGAAAAVVPGAAKDAVAYKEVVPDKDRKAGKPAHESVNGAAAAVVPGAAKDAITYREVKPDADNRAGEPTKDSVNGAAAAVVPGAARDAVSYKEVKPDADHRAGEPTKDSVNGAAAAVVPGAAKDAVSYKQVVPDKDDHAGRVKAEKVGAIFRPHPNHNHSEYAKVQPNKEGPGSPTTVSVNGEAAGVVPGAAKDGVSYKEVKPDADHRAGKPTHESVNGAAAAVVPGAAKDALSYKEVVPDKDRRAGKPTHESVNGAAAAVVPGAAKDAISYKEVKPDKDNRAGDPQNEQKKIENYPTANPSHDEPNLAFDDDAKKAGAGAKTVSKPKRQQSPAKPAKKPADEPKKSEQTLGGPVLEHSKDIPTVPTRLRRREKVDSMPIAGMEAPGSQKRSELPEIPKEVPTLRKQRIEDNVGVPDMTMKSEVMPDIPTRMQWQDDVEEEPTASPAIITRRAPIQTMDEDLDLIEDAEFESTPEEGSRHHRRFRGSHRRHKGYVFLQAPITPPSDLKNEAKKAAEETPVDMSITQSPKGQEYTSIAPKSTSPMLKKKVRPSMTAAPVETINPGSRSRGPEDLGTPLDKPEKAQDELKAGETSPISEDMGMNGDETMAPGCKKDEEVEQMTNPDATPMNQKLVNKMVELKAGESNVASAKKSAIEDEDDDE